MYLKGRVWKEKKFWLVECPALQAMTQGRSRKEALAMLADWIRAILDRPDFQLDITARGRSSDEVLVRVHDPRPIVALMIERNRHACGLTLQQIADRVGIKGRAAIKQYETGKHDPGFTQAQKLFRALGYDIQIDLIPIQKRVG